MAKVYMVASGKGGVGKTTVCANLGIVFANEGYRVILIDGDIGLNNLDVTFGIEDKVAYDVVDVLEDRVKLQQALVSVDGIENLRLLPSSKIGLSEISTASFIGLVNEVGDYSDIVLIDAPAGIGTGFHRIASVAKECIIVTTPHVSAIKDADRAISVLSTYGLKGIGLVVNRFRNDLYNKGEILDGKSIAELLKIPLYGVVPESDKLGVYATILDCRKDRVRQAYYDIKNSLSTGKSNNGEKIKSSFFRRLFG